MPTHRFFYPYPLESHQHLFLDPLEQQHLTKVMRARKGDRIEIVNGKGSIAKAEVEDKGQIHLLEVTHHPEPLHPTILVQALAKGSKLDWIVEKTTELGVDEIWLFAGALSEKMSCTQSRLESLMIAALKQSGRLYLPILRIFPSLKEVPFPKNNRLLFGDLSEDAPFLQPSPSSTLICIGPEKGFSKEEIHLLKEKDAQGVRLSRNILRTETAAITAIALLQSKIF